ncbi:Exosome complex component RRP4, partial [Coelomomyces lativittatus]
MHVRILLPTQLSLFQHPPPPQPLTTTPLSSLQHQPLRRHNPPVPSFHEKNHRNDNDDDMDLGEHEEDEEDPSTWMHLVTPGETIVNDAQFMKGHGAFIENETMLVANVQGVVERVNKLVSVRPLRTRY